MTAGRPTVTWQVGLVAALAIVLALAGAVSVFVRSSESDNNSDSIAAALKDLSSSTTVSAAATPTTAPPPFVAQDAGFSAVFPADPQRKEQQIQAPGVSLQGILYIVETPDEVVGTASATLATAPTGGVIQAGLDGAINGTVNNTKGTLVSKTMLTYVGGPAEEAVITTPSSGVVKERVLFHQRRIFVLLGIAEKADTPRPDYDRMVATFQPL